MAAPYNPPKKGEDFVVYIGLQDASNPTNFLINPVISNGDFRVSKDGGALTNLTTLPSVEPSGYQLVKVSLSATEMTADSVVILGIDTSGPKLWADLIISIPTTQ